MSSPKKALVLVVGSSNTDLVLSCNRLPKPGETLLGGEFQRFQGGKGANQAVAAARAGARVVFVGARGDDDFGQMAVKALSKEKIDLRHFVVRKGTSSGIALILVGGRSRENMIGVARSANDSVSVEDIEAARAQFQKAQMVVAQLEVPLEAILKAGQLARECNVPFLLNPAPARRLPRALLSLVHTLTPNEHEAVLLTGEKSLGRAGEKLVRSGCCHVVITCGARGVLLFDKDGAREFRAPKVKAVDTVGAGDCFTGWLATGLAEGFTMASAIELALQAAALSVSRPGAQSSMPYRQALQFPK